MGQYSHPTYDCSRAADRQRSSHAPPEQWRPSSHGPAEFQLLPSALHTSTPSFPSHCRAPGVHIVQPIPLTHAFRHGTAIASVPASSHEIAVVPTQRVRPVAQTPGSITTASIEAVSPAASVLNGAAVLQPAIASPNAKPRVSKRFMSMDAAKYNQLRIRDSHPDGGVASNNWLQCAR